MDINLLISIFLSTILLYSAISKIISYKDFKKTIEKLRFPLYTTWLVIAFEIIIAALLLIDSTRSIGEIGSLLLFLSFCFVAAYSIHKKLDVPCNCFGKASEEQLGWGTIGKAAPLFLVSLAGFAMNGASHLLSMGTTELIGGIGLSLGLLMIYLLFKNIHLFKGDAQP
ncbi:MauE/DoxX family redox-associated membrane protein [Paenibacillus solani]|uniref:MauE/DoxX family redox-associated membrane protein n=1 Tax=Paenibacillus solani TaxID=1705565 RepID=UPI003D271A10